MTAIRYIQRDTKTCSAVLCNEMKTARETKSVACGKTVGEKIVPWPDGRKDRRDTHIAWGGVLRQIHRMDLKMDELMVEAVWC